MMQITEQDNGRSFAISKGESFEVQLTEKPMAGRRWLLAATGEPVCSLLGDSVQASRAPVGGARIHLWTFQAVEPGRATIRLEYAPIGKGAPSVEKEFTVLIQVS
jgi:predicted secreted protein